MTFNDIIKGSFVEQFQIGEIDLHQILVALLLSLLNALYTGWKTLMMTDILRRDMETIMGRW